MFFMSQLAILVAEDNPLARKVMVAHLKDHAVDFAHDFSMAQKWG